MATKTNTGASNGKAIRASPLSLSTPQSKTKQPTPPSVEVMPPLEAITPVEHKPAEAHSSKNVPLRPPPPPPASTSQWIICYTIFIMSMVLLLLYMIFYMVRDIRTHGLSCTFYIKSACISNYSVAAASLSAFFALFICLSLVFLNFHTAGTAVNETEEEDEEEDEEEEEETVTTKKNK